LRREAPTVAAPEPLTRGSDVFSELPSVAATPLPTSTGPTRVGDPFADPGVAQEPAPLPAAASRLTGPSTDPPHQRLERGLSALEAEYALLKSGSRTWPAEETRAARDAFRLQRVPFADVLEAYDNGLYFDLGHLASVLRARTVDRILGELALPTGPAQIELPGGGSVAYSGLPELRRALHAAIKATGRQDFSRTEIAVLLEARRLEDAREPLQRELDRLGKETNEANRIVNARDRYQGYVADLRARIEREGPDWELRDEKLDEVNSDAPKRLAAFEAELAKVRVEDPKEPVRRQLADIDARVEALVDFMRGSAVRDRAELAQAATFSETKTCCGRGCGFCPSSARAHLKELGLQEQAGDGGHASPDAREAMAPPPARRESLVLLRVRDELEDLADLAKMDRDRL